MKSILCFLAVVALAPVAAFSADEKADAKVIPNAFIDYDGHREIVSRTQALRESRRLSEADFIKKAQEPGVVVLDARSDPMFRRLHLVNAVNLNFSEFTEESLAKVIPTKDTPVLIYCNNNFFGSQTAMPTKVVTIALNISTFVALTAYGYTNVYELGPLLNLKSTVLPLAGTEAALFSRKAVQ